MTDQPVRKEGFDRIFSHVGSNMWFQYRLLLIVALQSTVLSWNHLSYMFLAAVPDHWCQIPELNNSDWTEFQKRNISIPLSKDGDGWESCEYYDFGSKYYSNISSMSYEDALFEVSIKDLSTTPRNSCLNGYVFDDRIFVSTIVTEFETVCDKRYLVATVQSTYMGGVFLGSLVLGSLSDMCLGRRKSVLICVVIILLAGISASFASSYWMLIFLRFFVAFGVAGAYQNSYVLLMEYCGTKSRSYMGMFQQVPFAVSFMLMAVFAYWVREWNNLQLVYSLSPLILLSYFWILPESARWLAVQGKTEKSVQLLLKVAEANGKGPLSTKALNEITQLVKACHDPKRKKDDYNVAIKPQTFRQRFYFKVWQPVKKGVSIYMSLIETPEMRKRTLLTWCLFITVDLVYYGVVFNSVKLTTNPFLVVLVGGATEIPAYTLVVPFLTKTGRRPTIFTTFLITAICVLSVAYLEPEYEYTRVVISMLGKLFITSCFAVIYLLGTELYPTATRATGLAAAIFMGRVGSIVAPYIVDSLKSTFKDLPNIIFGAVCLFACMIAMMIPETNSLAMADTLNDIEGSGVREPHQDESSCQSESRSNEISDEDDIECELKANTLQK